MKVQLSVLVLVIATVYAELQETIYPKDDVLPAGYNNIEGRITNGYAAKEGEVPYIVFLSFYGGGGWFCGGSIIGNTWVLTAAHCTNGSTYVTIDYGATQRVHPQFTHTVNNVDFIQNPNWPNINGNDVSLIRTPHVDFSELIGKIELPTFNDANTYAGSWALACGWGKQSDDGWLADVLTCANLEIISNGECSQTYEINDEVLCVKTPQFQSTCSGDSGGPLVTQDGHRLVGVTSYGSAASCTAGYPAAFTRVTQQLGWIRDHTGIEY